MTTLKPQPTPFSEAEKEFIVEQSRNPNGDFNYAKFDKLVEEAKKKRLKGQ